MTTAKPQPLVNTIAVSDVWHALAAGLRDMRAAPLFSLSFGLAYAAFGWLILYLMIALEWGSYAYPLATGFALVAPTAAAGLYEISGRIELGLPVTLAAISSVFFGESGSAVRIMAVVTTFAYIIWLDIAAALYVGFWGMKSLSFYTFAETVFTTPKGILFLLLGNGIGAALAAIEFSIMVVSLPLAFDKKVDFVTAMITSVKSVHKNPLPMFVWCCIIGVLLMLSMASLFAGLLVVFPLLGHSTWHLYRKVVARD